jgi:uncharacterized protein (DUF58 family)
MQQPSLLTSQDLELLRFQAQSLFTGRATGSSPLSGEQRALYRGMGMELEELRAYQLGDDVRHIAWRASARSNLPITKVFRAERQQRVLLLVEQHPGMFFATAGELKATCAARVTALITFAALAQQGEVAGVVAQPQLRHFGYSNRLDHGLALIGAACATPAQQPNTTSITEFLTQAQRISGRGDTIFIISDFSHWHESLTAPLLQLSETRQLTAIQIIDRGEQTLPAIGKLRLRSPYSGEEVIIDSNNAVLRQQYAAAMQEKQQQTESLLQRCGVRHLQLHTDDDIFKTLAALL